MGKKRRKYTKEFFLNKLNQLTPLTNKKQKINFRLYREAQPLSLTKEIFFKKKNYKEVELKEFSILYLIINNLNVFEKKIELLSELKLYTKICIEFLNKIIDPGMSNMTSATEQVAIINFSTKTSAKVFDKPITFQIKVNTSSGSGTYQCGLIPLFCYFGAVVPKTWTTSSVLLHIHADLAHAFPIFRDEDNMNMLDTGIGV